MAQTSTISSIAPDGQLRVGMIAVGVVKDMAMPLGKFLADKLGAELKPVIYDTSPGFAESVGRNDWDLAIGARTFATSDTSDIAGDLYLVDLIYVVGPKLGITSHAQIDRSGVKVGVVQGSPSDRFITSTIKAAEIVRFPLSPNIGEVSAAMMRAGKFDVLAADAGIGHELIAVLPGSTMLPGAFHSVRVALLLPKGRPPDAKTHLAGLISEARTSGVVERAIDASGHKGLRVAPD